MSQNHSDSCDLRTKLFDAVSRSELPIRQNVGLELHHELRVSQNINDTARAAKKLLLYLRSSVDYRHPITELDWAIELFNVSYCYLQRAFRPKELAHWGNELKLEPLTESLDSLLSEEQDLVKELNEKIDLELSKEPIPPTNREILGDKKECTTCPARDTSILLRETPTPLLLQGPPTPLLLQEIPTPRFEMSALHFEVSTDLSSTVSHRFGMADRAALRKVAGDLWDFCE